MDRLTLARFAVPAEPDDQSLAPTDVIVPIIDGVPLHEVVTDRYPGVDATWVLPPSRHWLGDPVYGEGGRAVLLDGSCGISECCGVVARIVIGPDVVVWTDFVARGRPALPPSLHFEFDRADYEAIIAASSRLPSTSWPKVTGD